MKEQFRHALERLASPAAVQESYLQQLGTTPSADELALEFSDALGVLRDELDAAARGAALRLDWYLEGISGSENTEIWTVAALHTAPEWEHVRELASFVLRSLDVSEGRLL